jgi:thiol-disulfide isomerase/thioredoxin
MAVRELKPRTERAFELLGDFWLNGDPVIVSAMQGYVILLYFWDFSSSGSLHHIPYINEWSEKYAPFGMVTVGVHAPRFSFASDPVMVEEAIKRTHLKVPVVVDNDSQIRGRYDVREWPTMVMIDRHGFIRGKFEGMTGVLGVERMLQMLLYDLNPGNDLPTLSEPANEIDREGVFCFRQTPDIQAGYLRGSLGNIEGFQPESVFEFQDPGFYLDGRLYLGGAWENGRECAILRSDSGTAAFFYNGIDASGVLRCEPVKIDVEVKQDGEYLSPEMKGEDVTIRGDGKSILHVSEPRLYRIVRNAEYGHHSLTLSASDRGLSLFVFSFGTASVPELISGN